MREQNYIRRPLDLLRVHHEKIEAWILEQAGIVFDPDDRLYCVVFVDRDDARRVIMLRKANSREVQFYAEND